MTKYGIYQKGWLGEDLQNKYEGQNVFDLAGGVSFTIWQNADSEGYMSAVSLSFTSKSMRLTNAAGEFGGFAYDANRQVWKGFETIGRDAYKVVDMSWKIQDTVNWIEEVFESFIPFSNSNKQNGFFDVIENMSAILNKPLRLIQEDDYKESEMLYPVTYVNEDGTLRYEYQRGGKILTTSGTNNSQRRKRNELKIEKLTDGVVLTNMTEEQFNRAMEIVEWDSFRKFIYNLTSSDSREFKETVKKLEEMNDSVMKMQKEYGGVGENGKKLSLRDLVDQKGSVILGEAGKGMGQKTEYISPDGTKKYFDVYDDKFTVLTKKDGIYILGEFFRGNMNPTNSYESLVTKTTKIYQQGEETSSIINTTNWIERLTTNRNITIINTGPNLTNSTNVQINKVRDYIDGTTYWGELRDGIYGWDKEYSSVQGYIVLKLKDTYNMLSNKNYDDIGYLPAIRNNPVQNNNKVIGGVYFHKGGDWWNYSQGCQTIYKDDWEYFIRLFSNWSSQTGKDGIYFRY